MNNQNFSEFENEVVNALLAGNNPILEVLRNQFASAGVKRRELTGVGFYLDFLIPKDCDKLDGKVDLQISDVMAEVQKVENGFGFVLFVEKGSLKILEGFTYDEPWPVRIERFKLFYLVGAKLVPSQERDMVLLQENLLSKLKSAKKNS